MKNLTIAHLKSILRYAPDTGEFRWIVGSSRLDAGALAGNRSHPRGYVSISIDGQRYYAHRLAFFYMKGCWPAEIDHINGDASDNRLENLREATRAQNNRNRARPRNNTSGYKGVVFSRHARRWKAQIKTGRSTKSLGYFDTPQEAHAAYCTAATRLFGAFANLRQ